jgi:Domain of unknown function (DUF397)
MRERGCGMTIPDLSRAQWRKSSRSSGNGARVEITDAGTVIAVRDSKDQSGPVLAFTREDWRAFTAGVHAGEFDLA